EYESRRRSGQYLKKTSPKERAPISTKENAAAERHFLRGAVEQAQSERRLPRGDRAMEQASPSQPTAYPWGHAEEELERIISTARFLGDRTEHVLRLAGLDRGMRVLEVGCGPGDVTFLAAKLVGFEGTVIGVDKSEEAIGRARERAAAAGLTNVQFL